MNALQLENIDTWYGQFQVHRGLNLQVQAGEILCLLGSNASGKSTAMKVIMGLLAPRAGRVLLDGEDITTLPTHQRIRLGLGAVPEGRRVFARMSVEENLLMGAWLGPDRLAVGSALSAMYEQFPRLAQRRGQMAGTLSGGEQQFLALARCLMSHPRYLVLDEPTMGLSPTWVDAVLEMIAALKTRQKLGIILVEQDVHAALAIADRACVLQGGTIALEGPATILATDPRVRDVYFDS